MAFALFVDDDEETAKALLRALERANCAIPIRVASNEQSALQILEAERPWVAVVDLELDAAQGPQSGLELIPKLLERDHHLRIIVLTGHGSEEMGLEALKRGAASFVVKPVAAEHLKILLEDSFRFSELKRRLELLEAERASSIPGTALSTKNPKMLAVLEEVRFAGSMNQPLLLLGETGTGKGVIAKAVHDLSRPGKPFIRAQPTYGNFDLVQSELFGHERGAFTGAVSEKRGLVEEANGGTLFLDEIDALPGETQVLLLNVLQEKSFRRLGSNRERSSSFRLIAATNRSRSELERVLRPDLFHRIAHHIITVPPLRERPEDIESLANTLLRELSDREKLKVREIAPDALLKLKSFDWPGNIRELGACIQQAAFRARFLGRSQIQTEDIPFGAEPNQGTFRDQLVALEAHLLRRTLHDCRGNISETGRRLGIERTQLRRLLKKHGLSLPEQKGS